MPHATQSMPLAANADQKMTLSLAAASAFGLEAITKRELAGLGIEASIDSPGRIHFEGAPETIAQCNLWLRTADRVLIRIAEFPCSDFDTLFETTREINWSQFLSTDSTIHVTGRSSRSQLSSVPACQRSVKRAIVEGLKQQLGVSTLPESGPTTKIDIAIVKDQASLTIDTTGRSLHRRGYRTHIGEAPLKETLAAAMVLLSFWKAGRPLLDPFCGSGTIPIEASWIAMNRAPGTNREFSFQDWDWFPDQLLSDLRRDAVANENALDDAPEGRLIGRDIDGRVLRAARENAERAGVADRIHFQQGDFRDASSKHRFGCVVTNPPYGMRLGEDRILDQLYSDLPGLFARLPTWSHYVLTGFRGLEKILGREADRRRKLYNGRIETTYFQFHGPKPIEEDRAIGVSESETKQTVRLTHASGSAAFGQLDEKADHQADLFATRLRKRAKHLRRYPTRRGITCYRIYERDIPEIPLIVDRYENHLHITEYERPHDRDVASHANWLQLMAKTAGKALGVDPIRVHLKSRRRQSGNTQHEKVNQTDHRFEIQEGGLKFLVNLKDYIDTGLFLDHRITRDMVREESPKKRVLNLFGYTGSFTVYAADGNAKSTTTVDLSSTYLNWAHDNLKLNGLDGSQHEWIASDIKTFIHDHSDGDHYDLAVIDPPTFSNSKRTEDDWNLQNDSVPLINSVLSLMPQGGVIFFSNNFRRFKMNEADIEASQVHEISRQTVPEEFRNRRIHRCWRIVR
ncbi:MAG: bifunctional 23S rRNA (guanine(2069)-N(7))-methyltransferase RlmK/23S rRNA (guanine(2445)-N(2))-methyltransferase RlmL [Planctomycetota bacterium]